MAANSDNSSHSRSFFSFRKRNSTTKIQSVKPGNVEHKQTTAHRRRASLRFLRYRSNSTSSPQMKSCMYSTPEYCNENNIDERSLSKNPSKLNQAETNDA